MNTILGTKKEMTQIYNQQTGEVIPVTVVDVSEVKVVDHYKAVKNEVTHIVIGKDKKKNPNKSEQGKYTKIGYTPYHKLSLKVTDAETPEVGTDVLPEIFQVGDIVDVTGTNKGKGFQGVVKRWGFHGGPKTHGQSDKHRSPGSIGSGTTPGRVHKGKKMGGHMGFDNMTVKNLVIVGVDSENKLLLISGSIPGPKGTYITIQKAKYQKS